MNRKGVWGPSQQTEGAEVGGPSSSPGGVHPAVTRHEGDGARTRKPAFFPRRWSERTAPGSVSRAPEWPPPATVSGADFPAHRTRSSGRGHLPRVWRAEGRGGEDERRARTRLRGPRPGPRGARVRASPGGCPAAWPLSFLPRESVLLRPLESLRRLMCRRAGPAGTC